MEKTKKGRDKTNDITTTMKFFVSFSVLSAYFRL